MKLYKVSIYGNPINEVIWLFDKSNVCILGKYGKPSNYIILLFDKYSFSILLGIPTWNKESIPIASKCNSFKCTKLSMYNYWIWLPDKSNISRSYKYGIYPNLLILFVRNNNLVSLLNFYKKSNFSILLLFILNSIRFGLSNLCKSVILLLSSYSILSLSNYGVSAFSSSILQLFAYIAFIYGYLNNLSIFIMILSDKSMTYNDYGNLSSPVSSYIRLFDRLSTFRVLGYTNVSILGIMLLAKYSFYNFGNFSSLISFMLLSDRYKCKRPGISNTSTSLILHPSAPNILNV